MNMDLGRKSGFGLREQVEMPSLLIGMELDKEVAAAVDWAAGYLVSSSQLEKK